MTWCNHALHASMEIRYDFTKRVEFSVGPTSEKDWNLRNGVDYYKKKKVQLNIVY